ncbi:NYN domain-containing protein [Pannonibacter phragmitetus]|uniref:NYN domain-containing protein n=1 Tax=Pannonibacter phragmitetus TaxID=121719 RepID=A0A0U3Q980_9HYPH|nr:NYN domain-containing protein [Pannonibacter phragmitetus]ALV29097.1 hypothetical protein APZ00_20320 [Pannonibacter phragmitetus]
MRDVAILVDGSFFIKRINSLGHLSNPPKAEEAVHCLKQLCANHLRHLNKRYGLTMPPRNKKENWQAVTNHFGLLYRIFFYDAPPFEGNAQKPITKQTINYKNTGQAKFRLALFEELRKSRDVALRLGELSNAKRWVLHEDRQKALLKGEIAVGDLTDDDFSYDLKQKGVDMRIGLDIASLTLKQQVKVIVLVTGDADFVPAAKLARREGVEIILDPLRYNISRTLFEHIDGLRHGLDKAGQPEPGDDGELAENNGNDN